MRTEGSIQEMTAKVWVVHALSFVVGGIWAIVGRRSFEAITGPKTDYWLVRTVGGLLAAVGAVIGMAGAGQRLTADIRWLAIASSAVLTAVDLVYVARRRISPVYLLDAIANLVLIAGWLGFRERQQPGSHGNGTSDTVS